MSGDRHQRVLALSALCYSFPVMVFGDLEDLSLSNDASTVFIYEMNGIPGGDARKREA